MRKLLLAAATVLVITSTGLHGTALAATPGTTATIARQVSITIENTAEGDGDLSNMPEMSHDDTPNE
jgi:hypothetical protein